MSYDGPLTISALRAAYAAGCSAGDIVDAVYARIEPHRDNPIWIHLLPKQRARERADALDRAARHEAAARLPLFGIPFAVKDNIDVAALPTTVGCPDFTYIPRESASVVRRLLDAGALLVGKTNLDQFATGLVGTRSPYGACRNAFDARYVSGGSSSGSALAVALDLVSFALGTDTAGSGRVPAAFNNIVGLKPTPGHVSTTGVFPACRSLDCVSILAQDCMDARTVLDVIAGYDRDDPFARALNDRPLPGFDNLRVAVPRPEQREFFGDHAYAALFDATIRRVANLGAHIIEIDFLPFRDVQALLYEGPWLAERLTGLGTFANQQPAALHPAIRSLFERAQTITGTDVFRGIHRLAELRMQTDVTWQHADILLVPTAPTIYRIEQLEQSPIELNARLGTYTNFVNLLGLAAIAVPAGFRGDGLPFGVCLIGPSASERALTDRGAMLHAALGAHAGAAAKHMPRAPAARAGYTDSWVELAVVGAHLAGMPLNGQITSQGGCFARKVHTRDCYRLYALGGGSVPRPGLLKVRANERGGAIEAELWRMPADAFGRFVRDVPAPLAIGTIELADGTSVKGFLCESSAIEGCADITHFGSWRNYLAQHDPLAARRARGTPNTDDS